MQAFTASSQDANTPIATPANIADPSEESLLSVFANSIPKQSAVICLHKAPFAPPPIMVALPDGEIPISSKVYLECSSDNDTPSKTLRVKCAFVCVARIPMKLPLNVGSA